MPGEHGGGFDLAVICLYPFMRKHKAGHGDDGIHLEALEHLSQLSRASEQRGGDRKPILSDLRDSGAIEQDADIVLFIHRPEMYEPIDKEGNSNEGKAELIVAKHRNGPTGVIDLFFHKSITRFASLSDREDRKTVFASHRRGRIVALSDDHARRRSIPQIEGQRPPDLSVTEDGSRA